MPAADGKAYLTDVASAATLLRLVQSVPSPKAEPIKVWLAKVGYAPCAGMLCCAAWDTLHWLLLPRGMARRLFVSP